ncbi:hypothetical protein VMCG_00554 [Cytospora schulzeri]|uniref:DUF4211 domain-containing protein n=1 Tax=Cytospora schulzeri TaxID=448051 RepID=A0A423XA98_9PEZI|nr:hypothetical protein VMCG_00554 [Valsa malicola]
MVRPKKPRQQTLESSLESDSETPVEEDGGIDDTDGEGPPRHEIARRNLSRPSKEKPQQSDAFDDSMDDSDDEENNVRSSQSLPPQAAPSDDSDDAPLVTPRSSSRHTKGRRVVDDEEDDDDDDDDVVQTPAKRRKLGGGQTRQTTSVVISDDSDSSLPGTPPGQTTPETRTSAGPDSSARKTRSSARKGHRSEKEKRMELLRRRRAGEKTLTMSDLETEEEGEEGDRGALYDTDSDHQALDHFEDESEPEPDVPVQKSSKKKKGRLAKKRSAKDEGQGEDDDTENSDGNLASFIDDEDDTIGVPEEALYHMPLQFTRASRKPLKAHFRDAVEWLIHRRINPAFERDDEVYRTAWTRLNDEVMGLANSKFISAVWRPDFYRALKARPYFETIELGAGHLATEFEKCQACGRSGHPATWAINFKGKPYDNWTLDEIEKESDSEDSDGESDGVDYDADGNRLPPEDKEFFVGANCNSNAETAHCLLHWKPALRDWVNDYLERGGWLAPEKLAEREKMKAKKRRRLADEIVEDCDQRDIIKRLFADFKHNIEMAQTKDTSRTARGGRRYIR